MLGNENARESVESITTIFWETPLVNKGRFGAFFVQGRNYWKGMFSQLFKERTYIFDIICVIPFNFKDKPSWVEFTCTTCNCKGYFVVPFIAKIAHSKRPSKIHVTQAIYHKKQLNQISD